MYTPELADAIIGRLVTGESLVSITKRADMPAMHTVHDWITKDRCGFAPRYAQARRVGLEIMADELLQIADEPLEGITREEHSDGTYKITKADMLGHRRLQVDTRKWLLCKLFPKRYGNKTNVEVTGTGLTGPTSISPEERTARIKSLLALAEVRSDFEADTEKGPTPDDV